MKNIFLIFGFIISSLNYSYCQEYKSLDKFNENGVIYNGKCRAFLGDGGYDKYNATYVDYGYLVRGFSIGNAFLESAVIKTSNDPENENIFGSFKSESKYFDKTTYLHNYYPIYYKVSHNDDGTIKLTFIIYAKTERHSHYINGTIIGDDQASIDNVFHQFQIIN